VCPDSHESRFERTLDPRERMACLANHVRIKGMFFRTMVEVAEKHSERPLGRGKYLAFRDHLVPEFLEEAVVHEQIAALRLGTGNA